MFRIVFHKVFIIHDKLCRQGLFYFNVYGTGTISIIYEDYYKYDKYQKGDLRMYTGNYECLGNLLCQNRMKAKKGQCGS